MTYYIFLKSLRSLEKFRKNPHIKIPPTNFQSFGIFKNQIFLRKRIFPSLSAKRAQRPAGPSGFSPHAAPRPPSSSPRSPPPGEPLLSATVESTVEPWTGHRSAVHRLVDLVHWFFFSNTIPENSNFWHIALRPLIFSNINPQSLILQLGPWNLKNNSKKVPSLRKIHKNSPKLQNSISFQL
jgi:hypothetical protein